VTLAARDQPLLERVLMEHKSIWLPDALKEAEWREHPAFADTRCWIGVPLLASGQVLGILSLGSCTPGEFTIEHLRLAKSLAIPAAVAIQTARLHERAEIYGAELRSRLKQHETREQNERS
jgi:GAF domain-containing protein